MKVFKIITLSMFCALAFCSCKGYNKKLESGTWELDAKASYEVRNNKRHYFDERIKDSSKLEDYEYILDFSNGEVFIYSKEPTGEERKKYKYHTDKDHFYIDGSENTIIKLSNSKLIFECSDDDELIHYEFDNMYYSTFLRVRWVFISLVLFFVVLLISLIRFVYNLRDEILHFSWAGWGAHGRECEEAQPILNQYIESKEGMNEICEIDDIMWDSVIRGVEVEKEDGSIITQYNEEILLANGQIPFKGVGGRIFWINQFFVNSKGSSREFRKWLRTREGLDWQNTADGIIWTREQVFSENKESKISKVEWKHSLRDALIFSLIFPVAIFIINYGINCYIDCCIDGKTFSDYNKGFTFLSVLVEYSFAFIYAFILFNIMGMVPYYLIASALIRKWYLNPLIHFKDFSRRVRATNKAKKKCLIKQFKHE